MDFTPQKQKNDTPHILFPYHSRMSWNTIITQSWNYDKITKSVSWNFKWMFDKQPVSGTIKEGDYFIIEIRESFYTKKKKFLLGKIISIKPKTVVYEDYDGKTITKRTDNFIRIIAIPKLQEITETFLE